MTRSPTLPGQTNHPPAATKHPESPRVLTHAAGRTTNLANICKPDKSGCKHRTFDPVGPTMSVDLMPGVGRGIPQSKSNLSSPFASAGFAYG